jgi:signal transduction histidine kinase/ligand-binding sensor domain-containing protein/DNA-binding response OmpR family regulator
MKKKHVLFVLYFLATNTILTQNRENVSIQSITPNGGIAHSQITSIIEDKNGLMWFGTNHGLFSYNNITIKPYRTLKTDSTSIASNRINSFFKDHLNRLWIATENGINLYREEFDDFKHFKILDQFGEKIGKNIISFFQDNNKKYWFVDERGIALFNPKKEIALYHFVKNDSEIKYATINKGIIWLFYEDGDIYYKPKEEQEFKFFKKGFRNTVLSVLFDNNELWIGYSLRGLLCLDLNTGKKIEHFNFSETSSFSLPNNEIRSLAKNGDNIWAATKKGIIVIGKYKIKYLINKDRFSEIPHESVWTLYKDSKNSIWIGTWFGGICFYSPHNNLFKQYNINSQNNSLGKNSISSISTIPNSSKILVGSDTGEINIFNPSTNSFSLKTIKYNGEKIKNIKKVTFDKNETMWVGTYNKGVFYKNANESFCRKLTSPFSSEFQILDILATSDGIWVSCYPAGVYFYNFTTKKIKVYSHNSLDEHSISINWVYHIIEDKNHNIWFGTEKGLNLLKKDSDKFIKYFTHNDQENNISTSVINYVYEDADGYLWLGTGNDGLFKFNPKNGETSYFSHDGITNGDMVISILEDRENNLWITNQKGLCKFDRKTNTTLSFNTDSDILNNHFYRSAALKAKNGNLYFGGSNGMIRFRPEDIKENPLLSNALITDVFVNNIRVYPKNKKSNITISLLNNNPIKLKYNQNSISFDFTSDNYIKPKKNKYKYRLANFDETWIETKHPGKASFTNLPAGEYVFQVKAANNNNIWNSQTKDIRIIISPAIWFSWYAYLFYFIVLSTIIFIIRKQLIYRHKLKSEIKMSSIERKKDEQLYQMKLEFFTNISHEFRTPLTLIQGPVNRLLKDTEKGSKNFNQLSLIKTNTDRLLRLINQFLDFRRIENNKLKLVIEKGDIISFTKEIFYCFEELARERAFNYNFISNLSTLQMEFDKDKLDKALVNLISNAFKYSKDNGNIIIKILLNEKNTQKSNWNTYTLGKEPEGDFVEISICDSGFGITSENLPKIFKRFYQIKNNHNNLAGTGIGLSLSTNYIIKHKGQLIVSSLEGKGTIFSIYLPLLHNTKTTKTTPQLAENKFRTLAIEENSFKNLKNTEKDKKAKNEKELILIVEDNLELLSFLEETLINNFSVAKAKNGAEALKLASLLYPDLIVSDVMMPEMDGIELCNRIKNDIKTSHIPVILLTALSSTENQVIGINSGADAYVTKPFNEEVLIAKANNLLNSRKNLRALFTKHEEQWNKNISGLSLDKKLLYRAIKIVENNISNTEFTVEEFANSLDLSRVHLHRKLKALTDQSATEFIRSIRLKKAIELMKSGNYLIGEIGYAVGFNSPNYFTKAFKKQYGKLPSEFIRDNKESFLMK